MTTRQLQELLHVDRITIYRMLEGGRLPGFKVGGQWRFPRSEVEKWLQGQRGASQPEASAQSTPEHEPASVRRTEAPLPLSCLQAIQDILAEACEAAAITMGADGTALTEISRPCAFCRQVLSTEEGSRRCRASWRAISDAPATSDLFKCHAGLGYLRRLVKVGDNLVAVVLVGQILTVPDANSERVSCVSEACGLNAIELGDALKELPVPKDKALVARAARLLDLTAATVVEMGRERMQLLGRLKRIAEMSEVD